MRRFEASLLCLSAFVSAFSAFAAPRGRVASDMLQGRGALATSEVRPLPAPTEARADMARYDLRAYANTADAIPLQALLFTPKSAGGRALPMVVYFPGRGELGDVSKQFRQRAVFEKVTSKAFQEKYPCYLLAISPPEKAHTLMGGMPGCPSAMQKAIHEFVQELCKAQKKPRIDLRRIYLTGFSYGGNGAYALAQHYPGQYAAVVPIAALPPLPEYFSKEHPGNWWHFHNDGDYARHGVDAQGLKDYSIMVNKAGGDFRVGEYPAAGHDAWTKAWREDVVWDWMFSKSLDGTVKRMTKGTRKSEPVSVAISSVKCTASIPGSDAGSGPERAADGLDSTSYSPARSFTRDDWWQIEFEELSGGRYRIYSGDARGEEMLKSGYVECSRDGKRWTTVGSFSGKTGTCDFELKGEVRFVRVRSRSQRPVRFRLRRIAKVSDGHR